MAHVTSRFITEEIPKNHKQYAKENIKALMRKKMLKGKEFIHSLGFWDEYITFLNASN